MKQLLYPWAETRLGGIAAVRSVAHFLVLGEINGIGGRGRLQGGVLFKLRNVLRRAVGVGFGKNRGSDRARVKRRFLGARRWRPALCSNRAIA